MSAAERGHARLAALSSQLSAAPPLRVRTSNAVAAALAAGEAVVALESTIISHGMPWPDNLACAKRVEALVRACGATPATVAVLDGVCCVGLEAADLERLARLGSKARKVSRRDLPFVVAAKLVGATTVSATMLLASMAGVSVFVTGGLGGVHRGASESWDVSADLTELARTPVCVVCAGAKSILDIGKTLEVLETQGVAVCAFGETSFPAFYTRDSGLPAPWRVDSPKEAAAAWNASLRLGLGGGMVVAVPVPREHEAEGAAIEAATQAALREAEASGIRGALITPFLLKRVAEATGGASLKANVALVEHNARVGTAIAVELADARRAKR